MTCVQNTTVEVIRKGRSSWFSLWSQELLPSLCLPSVSLSILCGMIDQKPLLAGVLVLDSQTCARVASATSPGLARSWPNSSRQREAPAGAVGEQVRLPWQHIGPRCLPGDERYVDGSNQRGDQQLDDRLAILSSAKAYSIGAWRTLTWNGPV